MNAETTCANLLLAWKESQPPPGANTLIGWHICSWRFGAKWRLPAVSAEPSSNSPAELLNRRAVLLPLAESLQLPQQLLHSNGSKLSTPICCVWPLHAAMHLSVNSKHFQQQSKVSHEHVCSQRCDAAVDTHKLAGNLFASKDRCVGPL